MANETTELEKPARLGAQNEHVVMPMPTLDTAAQTSTDRPMCPHCGVYVDTMDDGLITEDTAIKRHCDNCDNYYILGGHFEFEFDVWSA